MNNYKSTNVELLQCSQITKVYEASFHKKLNNSHDFGVVFSYPMKRAFTSTGAVGVVHSLQTLDLSMYSKMIRIHSSLKFINERAQCTIPVYDIGYLVTPSR